MTLASYELFAVDVCSSVIGIVVEVEYGGDFAVVALMPTSSSPDSTSTAATVLPSDSSITGDAVVVAAVVVTAAEEGDGDGGEGGDACGEAASVSVSSCSNSTTGASV